MKNLFLLILMITLLTPCFAQQKKWAAGAGIGLGLTLDAGNKSSPVNYNNTTPVLYSAFI